MSISKREEIRTLYEKSQLSVPEIAAYVGCSRGTVYNYAHKGRWRRDELIPNGRPIGSWKHGHVVDSTRRPTNTEQGVPLLNVRFVLDEPESISDALKKHIRMYMELICDVKPREADIQRLMEHVEPVVAGDICYEVRDLKGLPLYVHRDCTTLPCLLYLRGILNLIRLDENSDESLPRAFIIIRVAKGAGLQSTIYRLYHDGQCIHLKSLSSKKE
jgi:predicted DNA-binding transcriptional regulator AlpA